MTYSRIYADETGESHYEDIEVELTPRDFAPPAPPLHLSPMTEQYHHTAFSRFVREAGETYRAAPHAGELTIERTEDEARRGALAGG